MSRSESSHEATLWTFEEKQRFVNGLSMGPPVRKPDGNVDWVRLKKIVGTKTLKEVKDFANYFNSIEQGFFYPEFQTKAAVDVWRYLATCLSKDDAVADACVPQVLTVAGFEPVGCSSSPTDYSPNYQNIYNYLAAATRGTNLPDVSPIDAAVILELLEDVVRSLSCSETLIQRDFMHKRYSELRNIMVAGHVEKPEVCSNSTNPFAIPYEILDFKNAK
ncbi:uncharacterized protein LOC100199488 isoform X1 [Hydra vulgaris]|uniref:uncharacterized protein LOC100199488 isoform X1 n=1 Tax=Hydra vulgaris TaxID=6087 RepID=UPI0006412DEA|nr:uncharacterized protein LOC100199488 isoform X1 [Hydra vulgaris]